MNEDYDFLNMSVPVAEDGSRSMPIEEYSLEELNNSKLVTGWDNVKSAVGDFAKDIPDAMSGVAKNVATQGLLTNDKEKQAGLNTLNRMMQIVRWPFWRFIEHPAMTVAEGIQNPEGKTVGEVASKALQAYVPFKQIPKDEYGTYGKVWNNYYKSIVGQDAPEWYLAMASYGSAMGLENPAIRGISKAAELAATRNVTEAEALVIRKAFEPLKMKLEANGLKVANLHKEGNIIRLSENSELYMNKYVTAVLRGDKIRVAKWAKVKAVPEAMGLSESTGIIAKGKAEILPVTGKEVMLNPIAQSGVIGLPEDKIALAQFDVEQKQEMINYFKGRISKYSGNKLKEELEKIPSRFLAKGKNKGLYPDEALEELRNRFGIDLRDESELVEYLSDLDNDFKTANMEIKQEQQILIAKAKELQNEKKLSNFTVSRIKQYLGIKNMKQAEIPQLQSLVDYVGKLEEGDKLLSSNQLEGLKEIIASLPEPQVTPKRVVIDEFGEKTDLLNTGIIGKISNNLIPSVDIKQGHPLIERIVNKADDLMNLAEKEVERRDVNLHEMIKKAEKSRKLGVVEKGKRFLATQNKEIFAALSGQPVELTKEEVAVVAYLKNFFKKVRTDLQLDKYRKNYITHLERPLMEKIVNDGLLSAVKDIFKIDEGSNIPINIMLELDNIIGSEKFFKYAQERKGGLKPTTNIRKIVHAYSNLYETKKALDQILPEGQAITKLLLKDKSALWAKTYLQNLKGRGLDFKFRSGKMGWVSKVGDAIVDVSYLKLLALNKWSVLKNIVAGEANNWIVQDFPKYLAGKGRFFANPKRAVDLANEYGILEGLFAEYAQQGIGGLKKIQDFMMLGQKFGEWEIRTSMFMGELTPEEYKSGEIPPEKIRAIKDMVAISQGRFTKTETPLALQTFVGRMAFQMNRWRVTNALLFRRLANDAKQGKNVDKFLKMFFAYGVGMYASWELRKAGYTKLARVAQSMAETINNSVEIMTLKPITDALTNNPTYSALKEFAFSIQEAANYIAPALVEEPEKLEFNKGVEDTYIAPVENIEEFINLLN